MKKLVLLLLLACAGVAQGEPRQPEVLSNRPSGFWTSNRPAVNGAYRWRLLGIGVVIAGIAGIVMMRVLRNTKGPPDRFGRR